MTAEMFAPPATRRARAARAGARAEEPTAPTTPHAAQAGAEALAAVEELLRLRLDRLAGEWRRGPGPEPLVGDADPVLGEQGLPGILAELVLGAGKRFRPLMCHWGWLAAGGSESGLMAIAGWTRSDMLVRYTRAGASERAADEARRLNLGDL